MPERQVPGSADVLTKPDTHVYRERHGVVVTCRDARHQEQVYAELRALGLRCRVVSV
ncbi:hypothetical protein JOD54_001426 [Actinokineospora baliensis]|uniref:hypothetical protein n=1 Tax=Actinokineospora baliensis TaxID=547056 RepID=UPI00195AD7F1|nr:hypothetical protein [Actinokineospora baliensis]MBM7771222.1 hypothetical protein [Actinokineospora baliensis]